MSLTDAGTDLLAASQKMTRAAQEGLAAMNRRVTQPVGKLSIALNTASANLPYANIYTDFSRAYPKIELDLSFTDRAVKLEGSRFDVAIRGTTKGLEDSSYRARKLGLLTRCLFASPEYVRGRPTPKTIDDLADWDRIVSLDVPWRQLARGADGSEPTTEPNVIMTCDSYTMARNYVDAGLGFTTETLPLIADDLRTGKLVQIMPERELSKIEVYAIYPANAARDSLARIFVDFLTEQTWMIEVGFEIA